jgi:IclR family transcriptional regulator, KDG regulon repressor
MKNKMVNEGSFSSLRNALRLLNLFTSEEPELNLSDISTKLNIGISTAHRLTATLVQEGFIKKDSFTKNFRLGSSILGIGNVILSQYDLIHISQPILEQMVHQTGETAHISVLKNMQVVYLQKVDCKHPVYLLSHVGKHNPICCTSSGLAILAYQPDFYTNRVIELGLPAYTSNTITNPASLKVLLSEIRSKGYAYSREEMHKGVSSIAAPIRDFSGEVIASVSIAGPSSRINPQKQSKLSKAVKKAGENISEQLKIQRKKSCREILS